ncbi:competence protein comEA [Aerococcus agrisoli]|uniref:Competence protein comEA n=2 Tax=Aerococcus agrisoli TaxID=2487350 RepID=A0A3N4GEY2_9LACT|nr:competence protein comEA [Aerococcus agrisoli]
MAVGVTIILFIGLGVYTATQLFGVPSNQQDLIAKDSELLDTALALENDVSTGSSVTSEESIASLEESTAKTATSVIVSSSVSSQPVTWYVDVKGAVRVPQVVPVTEGMRIHDAIALAGGLTPDADQAQVNLAQLVTDQMVIYVPKTGEEVQASVTSLVEATQSTQTSSDGANASISGKDEAQKININTADANELQNLSGIGEKRAADIIQYREINGPFETIDDLDKVSGIGEKTMENLRDFIVVK